MTYYRLDRHRRPTAPVTEGSAAQSVDWRHLYSFDRSYWYILGLHVLFAAVFFPFRTTYVIEYFQHVKGLTLQQASFANRVGSTWSRTRSGAIAHSFLSLPNSRSTAPRKR